MYPLKSSFLFINLIISTASFKILNKNSQPKSRYYMNIFNKLFNSNSNMQSPNMNFQFTDSAPSWNEIDQSLKKIEPPSERDEFDSLLKGRGKSNHKANIRLFDAPEGYVPEVTLYRDSAGWCPYCEKVWLQLEEKQIPYKVEKVPMRCYGEKPRSFYALNPSGGIPVANIKGKIISESNDIINLIEQEFPTYKPLYPPTNSPQAARVPGLLKLERRVFGSWFNWLISNGGKPAADEMDRMLSLVDSELAQSGGPYFLGNDISIVDIMFTPFLERMAASLPYYKGFEVRHSRYPHLLQWYEAMDTRPAYSGIKSDYYTHCHDLPPQIGTCYFRLPEAKPYRDEIDGGCWKISQDTTTTLEPMLPTSIDQASREALRNVINNKDNLIRFSLRALGKNGSPPVSAPLADPNAIPNEAYQEYVDSAFRHISTSLLSTSIADSDSVNTTNHINAEYVKNTLQLQVLQGKSKVSTAEWPVEEVSACMVYVRDRVGVPRDMSVHAARLLRSHINLFLDILHNV